MPVTISESFRRSRLVLGYHTEAFREGKAHRQSVTLTGTSFNQTIEAVGVSRPHSRISRFAWRWACPRCEQKTDLLLARVGRPFTCLDCHGRGGEFVLSATFAAQPPEVRQ